MTLNKEEEWWGERERLAWAKGLKVGDIVCDCRYKHFKIKEVTQRYGTHPAAIWIADKLTIWMGEDSDIGLKAFFWIKELAYKLGVRTYVDSDIVLEDGGHCSAMSCCDDPKTCACTEKNDV